MQGRRRRARGGQLSKHAFSDRGLVAARHELLTSVERWRGDILKTEDRPSTLWFGVAMRSVALAEVLMARAVEAVAPTADIPDKPTLGDLRQVLERHGRKTKMACLGRPRNMVTATDLRVFDRLVKTRNSIAHPAHSRGVDPGEAGHFTPGDVLAFLDDAEAFARLPMFEELECRQAAVPDQPGELAVDDPTGATTSAVATLYANDDYSRCGACGQDADPREVTHLNVSLAIPPGCGARFTAVSSDLEMTPELRVAIAAMRPDLPLLGETVH